MLKGRVSELDIKGPAGILRAIHTHTPMELPEQHTTPLAIICHPNPQQGGTMNNKVVTSVARVLCDLNIASIRFNFRGVGGSTGEHDGVQGALADIQAVLHWAIDSLTPRGFLLVGFSFGSYIAFQAAQSCPDLAGLICIAPPVDRLDFQMQLTQKVPWLVVLGLQDEVVPSDQMVQWAERVQPSPQLVAIPNVGHFFHGQLPKLYDAVMAYVQTSILTTTAR